MGKFIAIVIAMLIPAVAFLLVDALRDREWVLSYVLVILGAFMLCTVFFFWTTVR